MPSSPYLVTGTIYTKLGTIANTTVIINSDIRTTTNSSGQYVLDLANLGSGYTAGATYTIESYDQFNNEYKSDTITVTGASLSKDLTLEVRRRDNEAGHPTGLLTPVLIRSVGDKPTTNDNPLPVQNTERPFTQKIAYSGTNPIYIGEAPPGTPTSSALWRIKKLEYSGSLVTGTVWANGSADFDKVWDNRTSYSYN